MRTIISLIPSIVRSETLSQDTWTAVDEYINTLFFPRDDAIDAALQASIKADLPPANVSPTQGKLLQLLAQIQGARTILEIGTLGGYSTIWLARALPADGHLITLEVNPKHAQVAESNIARAGLSQQVELRLGPGLDSLEQLIEQKWVFDFIFIDADKPNNPNYLTFALRLSHPGTVIVVDNVIRDGAVINAESTDKNVQGVREFNTLLSGLKGVSVTQIQTVGSKGYDGFALIRVLG